MTAQEALSLKEALVADGCREPLAVWRRSMSPEETEAKFGSGVCKGTDCRYEYQNVPWEEWRLGDGRWECPVCGYGIAPWETDTVLLDGHNRMSICERLGIEYQTVEIDLEDREDALDWIDRNQIARRNLSLQQFERPNHVD